MMIHNLKIKDCDSCPFLVDKKMEEVKTSNYYCGILKIDLQNDEQLNPIKSNLCPIIKTRNL